MDSPTETQGSAGGQSGVVAAAAEEASVQHVNSDSGSSTEVDEDDENEDGGGQTAARVPPRLPATWAFSQRAVGDSAATRSAAQGVPIRRRLR